MNDQIRQLAEQAGIDFFNSTDPEYFGRVYCEGWSEQQQKFAELIVRECVKVCADRGKHHDSLYSAWASDCSERIGKHFGVEE